MSMIQSDLLLGQEGGAGYAIERSLRFNSSDSASLSRTPASAGNRKTWTWSGWVKRSASGTKGFFAAGSNDQNQTRFVFDDRLVVDNNVSNSTNVQLITTQVFRDFSAWYNIVVAADTTQATTADRLKIYVNGVQVTAFATASYPAQNLDFQVNTAQAHIIGYGDRTPTYYFDGYLADIHFIDGQALDPTSFTEVDATTGQLVPIEYTGTYGTNGSHLPFSDNSTAAALGTDTSGNSNTWTVNNISVAAGSGNDSLVDTPTSYGVDAGNGGEVRGNYATLNPLRPNAGTLSNGNLDASIDINGRAQSSIALPSGKWYAEFTMTSVPDLVHCGLVSGLDYVASYISNGQKTIDNTSSAYGLSCTANDIIGIAIDIDAKSAQFFKNGSSQGSFNWSGTYSVYNLAFESRGVGTGTRTATANFGQRPFAYTAPSGYKALCDTNLPAPVVAQPSTVMDVKLYTGNGSTQTISGLGFSPDLVWIKARNTTYWHELTDSVRGTGKTLFSNATDSETTTNTLTAFNTDGFTVAVQTGYNGTNESTRPYAAWTWDAGSSTVTNTQGSITSQVRANASAGFSIVTFTGNSTAGATVGHGLGVAPAMVIAKIYSTTSSWLVYHQSLAATEYLVLNSTAAKDSTINPFNDTRPSSTVVSLGGNVDGTNSGSVLLYCFAPVSGYSSFGSYTGNGSTDGPFVYTGFRPRWVMIKVFSGDTGAWRVYDSSRNTYNVVDLELNPNLSGAEYTASNTVDFTSNGFKIRTSSINVNLNTAGFIYAAFAESPFQYARAR